MAYASLVSLAQTIDQILNHPQYSISVEEKQQIKSIHDHNIHLQAFLENFPEKAKSLEGRIRDAANEAEDFIEFLLWNQMRSGSGFSTPSLPTYRSERYEGHKYAHYLNLFSDLKIVTAGEVTDIRIKQGDSPAAATSSSSKLAPTNKDGMINIFDNDLVAIKNLLCEGPSQLQVIPIFGRGGIGKTTLTRYAYDDPLIKKHFRICSWITVSKDFSAEGIMNELLFMIVDSWPFKPFFVKVKAFKRPKLPAEKVYKKLKKRRYLIVMDDMWSTGSWDAVRNIFPDENNGSRIILTTRLSDVATYPDIRSSIYEMQLLDEDRSWNLLRYKAFAYQDCPLELENIGKEIARGCRGLPLAIVVSAGLLSTISKNPALWGEIAETVNSVVAANDGHLPQHLKPWSLYMDEFQKDHVVSVSELSKLWIASIKDLMLSINHPHRAQFGVHIHDLETTAAKIESIVEQVKTISNSFGIKDKLRLGDSPVAASSSKLVPTHKDVMIGFDNNLMAIKDRLYGQSSNLQVIPIVGMGGIGKTTLARNAYDDPLIMEHFTIRAWVTISQDYSVEDILSSLLVSMEGFNDNISGNDNKEKVFKSLKGRRYLIVMDDIWSTKAWDEVRNIFPNDGNGSRIMLTTRLLDVASYPNLHTSIYEMDLMNEDQSWNLLHQKVFAQQGCPSELESIGKVIARSCKGLPLAIVVVAGLLSTISKNPTSWEEIAENVNSAVAGKDGEFEEMLSLSYTHLPHHLRPCFLYLGVFPEDLEVHVSKLVKLWVAEGFLKCPNGSKSLEEEAEECLENLIKRNLVLITKRKSDGRIKSCRLHDLMRDLCIRKAHEEKFLANIRDQYVAEEPLNQRRMSIAFPCQLSFSRNYGSTIHTLMWFNYDSLPSLESHTLLRVLDAGDADVETLPTEIFEFFYLRYLAINYPRRIPTAIGKLQNLQTLIVRARGQWKHKAKHTDCLPQEIWRMPQLRHLVFYGTLPVPEGTSILENLQTLVFSLSIYTTEEILKRIPNLRKLIIMCYDRRGRTYFKNFLNNLVCLHLLESLEVHSLNSFDTWEKFDFNFPRMLKKLTLSGLRLSWNDMMALCSLSNLQVLKLKDHACIGSTWKTAQGDFPKLEYLLIGKSYLEDWMLIEKSNLEDWTTESCHFPSLKFLLIHDCSSLSKIPNGIGEIPTLELIEIKGHVKESLVESAKGIKEEQHELGTDDLQVRVITH